MNKEVEEAKELICELSKINIDDLYREYEDYRVPTQKIDNWKTAAKTLLNYIKELEEDKLDLQNEYNSLDEEYVELQREFDDLENNTDEYKAELENLDLNAIYDLDLFKEKLEFYGFKSDDLFNFIDDYMKLYNKK